MHLDSSAQIDSLFFSQPATKIFKLSDTLSSIDYSLKSIYVENFKRTYSYRNNKATSKVTPSDNIDQLDSLLCLFSKLEYLYLYGYLNESKLACVLDSLKYLEASMVRSFPPYHYTAITTETQLEEVEGEFYIDFLGSLLKNSPKIKYVGVSGSPENKNASEIQALEDMNINNYDSLVLFAINYRERICPYRKELIIPDKVLNAPNIELLHFYYSCSSNFFKRKRYFEMPELKNENSRITRLTVPCDLSNPHTLEQIKKLPHLEYLAIGLSKPDFSVLDELKHIPEIRLFVSRKVDRWFLFRGNKIEEIKKDYPNLGGFISSYEFNW